MITVLRIFIFIIFSSYISLFAQTKVLTLNNAIDIALEKSYQVKSMKLSLIKAEENLAAAKGRFKTNAEMNLQVPTWSEHVSELQQPNALPVFNTTSTYLYQGNLDINQPLPTNGLFTLRSYAYHRDISNFTSFLEKEKRKEIYTSLSLRFSQPLFTINTLKLGLKTANLNHESTLKRFKRSELEIVYNVTSAFFSLYQATRRMEIAEETTTQQRELYDLSKKKYEAGLIPEVEALQMEVDLAEQQNDLVSTQGELSRRLDSFKQLIGLQLSDQITVKTDFDFQPFAVDLTRAVEIALDKRLELRETEIDIELAKISVKQVDAYSEVKADVSAFYDITGVSDPYISYNSSLGTLWNSSIDDLKDRPNNRGVAINFTIPLWDWGVNKAQVQAAKADLKNSELYLVELKKTIEREVRNVVSQLKEAENRLNVLDKNRNVAQRAFDISLKRFENGDITSQDLSLVRNQLTNAKFSYLGAYIDYKLAIAELKKTTMWDFEKDTSVVD